MQCPICNNKENLRFVEYHNPYKIYECFLCKGQFSDPLDIDADTYKAWYRESSAGEISYKSFVSMKPKELIRLYRRLPYIRVALKLIKKLYGCKKLLDIGCSQGAFCKIAKNIGFDAYGIEPSQEAVKYANEKLGLSNILSGSFTELPGDWKDYDVITSLEVIEHLNNPEEMITKAFELLRPGGYVLITTPNNNSLNVMLGRRDRGDFPPHHLTRWRPVTLKFLLDKAGFINIILKNTPINREVMGTIFVQGLSAYRSQVVGIPTIFKDKKNKVKEIFVLSPLWIFGQFIGDLLAFFLNLIFFKKGKTLVALAQKPL